MIEDYETKQRIYQSLLACQRIPLPPVTRGSGVSDRVQETIEVAWQRVWAEYKNMILESQMRCPNTVAGLFGLVISAANYPVPSHSGCPYPEDPTCVQAYEHGWRNAWITFRQTVKRLIGGT